MGYRDNFVIATREMQRTSPLKNTEQISIASPTRPRQTLKIREYLIFVSICPDTSMECLLRALLDARTASTGIHSSFNFAFTATISILALMVVSQSFKDCLLLSQVA